MLPARVFFLPTTLLHVLLHCLLAFGFGQEGWKEGQDIQFPTTTGIACMPNSSFLPVVRLCVPFYISYAHIHTIHYCAILA